MRGDAVFVEKPLRVERFFGPEIAPARRKNGRALRLRAFIQIHHKAPAPLTGYEAGHAWHV